MFWPLIRLLPKETHFKFVSFAPIAAVLSGLAVAASILSFVFVGLNLGTDFKGGTLIEVLTPGPAPLGQLRADLAQMGVNDPQVQGFGSPQSAGLRFEPTTTAAWSEQTSFRAWSRKPRSTKSTSKLATTPPRARRCVLRANACAPTTSQCSLLQASMRPRSAPRVCAL